MRTDPATLTATLSIARSAAHLLVAAAALAILGLLFLYGFAENFEVVARRVVAAAQFDPSDTSAQAA